MYSKQQTTRDFAFKSSPLQYRLTVRKSKVGIDFNSSSKVCSHANKLPSLKLTKRKSHSSNCIVMTDFTPKVINGIVPIATKTLEKSNHTSINGCSSQQEKESVWLQFGKLQTDASAFIEPDKKRKLFIEQLKHEIEVLREKLNKVAMEKGIAHPEVLNISVILDILLNKLNKIENKK